MPSWIGPAERRCRDELRRQVVGVSGGKAGITQPQGFGNPVFERPPIRCRLASHLLQYRPQYVDRQ